MADRDISAILGERVVRDFRQIFYEITGMFTSFYFSGWKKGQVDCIPRGARPRFCRIMQSSREGMARCLACDAEVAEAAKQSRKPIIAPCHAGITGVAVPVFFRDEFLGTVFAGDVLSKEPTEAHFRRIRARLECVDIDFEELEKAYFEVPVVPSRTTRLAVNLLSLIVNYIVDREQIIDLQESIYQKQKEIARTMALHQDTEKGLLAQMDEVRKLREQLLAASSSVRDVTVSENDGMRRKRIVDQALLFIDAYYSEDITLEDVADHVQLSPGYFSNLFRKECGYTFSRYLSQKRMNSACELLCDLNLNVTEVSRRVGYSDIAYFSRTFKKLMGISPGRYRDRVCQ